MPLRSDDAVIKVRDLKVDFANRRVLNDVNLDLKRGEILGFVGASGAGKSVLTRTIIGLLPIQGGTIEVLGVELSKASQAGDQGGTYNGNPLMTAVGVAVMRELLKPDFLPSVRQTGAYLSAELLKLCDRHGLKGERGEGLLRALELGSDIGPQIVDLARERNPVGLLLNSPRPNLLRFMPALNVSKDEIDQMIAGLSEILTQLKQSKAA